MPQGKLKNGRGPRKLVHEYDGNGRHRLNVGNIKGPWTGYAHICTNGQFAATTEYWDGTLPRVFKLEPVPAKSAMFTPVPAMEAVA